MAKCTGSKGQQMQLLTTSAMLPCADIPG